MAGISSEDSGSGSSTEGISSGQQPCESGEALVEWRSSEQLENGTPSTSPPYWDTDDDDDFGTGTMECILGFRRNGEVLHSILGFRRTGEVLLATDDKDNCLLSCCIRT